MCLLTSTELSYAWVTFVFTSCSINFTGFCDSINFACGLAVFLTLYSTQMCCTTVTVNGL